MQMSRFWPHNPESGIGSSCIQPALVQQTHRPELCVVKKQQKYMQLFLLWCILVKKIWNNSCTSPVFGHTSQNQVQAVLVHSPHIADAQARIMWELKCKKIHVTVLVLVYSSQKNVGIIYANVPFLATQLRIRYRQFLYIARIYSRRTSQNHVGVKNKNKKYMQLFLLWSILAKNIWNNSCTSPVLGHTSQNQVLAVLVHSPHIADAQARIMWELKCEKMHVVLLVLVCSDQKNVGVIYTQVPFWPRKPESCIGSSGVYPATPQGGVLPTPERNVLPP